MYIEKLGSLPDAAVNSAGWEIRGLKLLIKSQLHTPESLVFTDIQSESDADAVAAYCGSSGMATVIVRSSVFGRHSAALYDDDLCEVRAYLSGADEIANGIYACIRSFREKTTHCRHRFFCCAGAPKLGLVVQSADHIGVFGKCATEDKNGESVVVVRAQTPADSTQHTYRILENDGRFFIENPNDDALIGGPVLTQIAREAMLASQELGFPLLLEWALADDRLIWFGARPQCASVWQNPSATDSVHFNDDHLYATSLTSDLLPGAVTPLTHAIVAKAMDTSIRQAFVKYKCAKRIEDVPENIGLVSVDNHLFLDVTEISRLAEKQPEGFKELIEISLCGEVLDTTSSDCWNLILADFVTLVSRYFKLGSANKDACQKIVSLAENYRIDLSGRDMEQRIFELNKQLGAFNTATMDFFTILSTAYFLNTALYLVFIRALLTPTKSYALMLECLSDLQGYASSDITASLISVAREMVLDNPRIADDTPEGILASLRNVVGDSKAALDAFMTNHGHRGFQEMELSCKTWGQNEADLAMYLHTIFSTNLSDSGRAPRSPGYLNSVEERIDAKILAPVKSLIDLAREAAVVSDTAQSQLVKMLAEIKQACRQIGRQMAEQKQIPDADLVFFLTLDELSAVTSRPDAGGAEKSGYAPDWAKRAFARKQLFGTHKNFQFERMQYGRPVPLAPESPVDTPKNSVLKGRCGSPGVLVGKARVVRNLSDLDDLKAGEIIVTAFSDIGFAPYFSLAGALITEEGSENSTAAVAARHLSLPHITQVESATCTIKTGDTLSVNAALGEITVLG